MTRLRRKLNSMFCNKVNFIFTRELSYSCCGNHHFESLDFGAFKFSVTPLHTKACFAWTFNMLHTVAWLPWTWESCEELRSQPSGVSRLPSYPDTYATIQRTAKKSKWSWFYLETACFSEPPLLSNTKSQAMSAEAGNVIAFVCSQDSRPRVFLDLHCVIQYTRGDLWLLQVLACAINHAGMHSHTSELIGAPEKLSNISQSHIKPKHL